ncbi:MAG: ABC transporter permease [Reyranella sp.]|uniref:ABC transporter permease n=1 Tax=Reyranella sp. TaxID=1929291 RepID=UPI0012056837|nr:ABC transporter permease [Reyranella sp.]TAJ85510.1 MAG: ABC transporter permease [Reyranella sp.]TBR24868.1 MAG: ABC transporter permease [Reyranella sp.]
MWSYLGRRLIQVPLVLLVVSLMTFAITRATPGDPVTIMLGMQTSPEAAKAMREEFNLDRSLPEQYGLWIAKVLTGDLGRSMRLNDRVTTLIAERLPISLQLASAGMLFALLVSIPLGVIAALRRNSWIDYLCTGYTVLGFAVPNFGLALILIYVFSIRLDWLPITGIGSSEAEAGGFWKHYSPFIIPAIALGSLQTAMLTRLLRSSMIDVLSQDYMRTARAKGLLPANIVIIHALKNAMIPFVTMAAVQFGYMIGVQVTIEYIFAVPGMGSAVLNAVINRDFPVIQGFTLVIAVFFLVMNILADMMYALLDPRIRY